MSSILYTCRVEYNEAPSDDAPSMHSSLHSYEQHNKLEFLEWTAVGKQSSVISCARIIGYYQALGRHVQAATVSRRNKAGQPPDMRDHVDVLKSLYEGAI